ncbi:hypothetical protein D9M68_796570 [compost metagenome]
MQGEAAVVRDVGGFGSPGRHRAQARHHQQGRRSGGFKLAVRLGSGLAVGQQFAHACHQGRVGLAVEGGQMHEAGREAGDLVGEGCQSGQELLDFEVADGIAAIKSAQVQGHVGSLRCVDPGGGRSADFTRVARPVIAADTLRRMARWDNLRP